MDIVLVGSKNKALRSTPAGVICLSISPVYWPETLMKTIKKD